MSEKLLPCPFCGSSAEMRSGVGESWVYCSGCRAETPMDSSPAEAAAKWNARVPVVAAPVQVDDASVCRFLERLRDLAGHGYVTSGGGMDRAYVIDGVWSTEELRAAILAALGQQ